MRAVPLTLFSVLAMGALAPGVLSCGNSDPVSPDAEVNEDAAIVDAAIPDAAPPDAFDPCPGETALEIGMVDWETGDNLAGVSVREGDTGNAASSAPNGRVVLCLAGTGPVDIRLSKTGYLDRVHTTSVEAIAAQYATGQAPSFRMLTPAAADTVYASVSATRAADATTFIAMMADATTGTPLSGANVAITASNEGAFTPSGAVLLGGSVSQADGKVVFLNAAVGGGSTEASVTGPTSCEIPASVVLAAGVSSVAIRCQP